MLKRVEIENYRSCRNVVLDDLGPMTVLLGRNAVGKTNILRAIQWAAEAATSSEVSGDGTITLEIQLGESVYRYSLKMNIRPNLALKYRAGELIESLEIHEGNAAARKIFARKGKKVKLFLSRNIDPVLGTLTPCTPAIVSLLKANTPEVKLIRPFLSALERIRYYPLEEDDFDTSNVVVPREQYDSWLSRYSATDDPGNSVLLRLLHLFQTYDALSQEIRDLLGSTGLGLVNNIRLDSFKSHNDPHKLYYSIEFQPSEQADFLFFSLSAGTQRIIRLIVSLLFDQSSVLLIEHHEDSIHRGLLRKVIDVLQGYSDQHQLILSSHSSVVFDTLDPKAVRLVTMENDVTKVRPLTPEELRAAKLFMEEEGSLSDFIETVEEE
ncbi:MAG: AAA family ATPase [Pirellulales bacterium]|nr:AAA family ATPase [Pirellulales bacterium]